VSAAYSADGRHIASLAVRTGRELLVWEAQEGRELFCLEHENSGLENLAWLPDGRLVTASSDGSVQVWDGGSGKQLHCLSCARSDTAKVFVCARGERIAVASASCVRVYDAKTGKENLCFAGHRDRVCDVAFSPDGTRAVSVSRDWTLRVWDTSTAEEHLCIKGFSFTAVAWSLDGLLIAAGCDDFDPDANLILFDASSGAEVLRLRGHEKWVECVAFSPTSNILASGSLDGTVLLWDTKTGCRLACFLAYGERVRCVAFSPDGGCVVSGSDDGIVRVWNLSKGSFELPLRSHSQRVNSIRFSFDTLSIVSGAEDGSICLWDTCTGSRRLCIKHSKESCYSVSLSPSDRFIASASGGTIYIWDARTGAEIRHMSAEIGSVEFVEFRSEETLISGHCDQRYTVREWSASTGECLNITEGGWSLERSREVLDREASRLPWRAVREGAGTCVRHRTHRPSDWILERVETGEPEACIPDWIDIFAMPDATELVFRGDRGPPRAALTRPKRDAILRTWACSVGNHLAIFRLEGCSREGLEVLERLKTCLEVHRIRFQLSGHEPVFNSKEAARVRGEPLRRGAKSLVLHIDGRIVFFVLPADRRLSYRMLRRNWGSRCIRFATKKELRQTIGLEGGIPPFGSLFGMKTICDTNLVQNEAISFNAGDERISITIDCQAYIAVEKPMLASISEAARTDNR